jgi:hypothetical protein
MVTITLKKMVIDYQIDYQSKAITHLWYQVQTSKKNYKTRTSRKIKNAEESAIKRSCNFMNVKISFKSHFIAYLQPQHKYIYLNAFCISILFKT